MWNSLLTQEEEMSLELVQRTSMDIIGGENQATYIEACIYFYLKSLNDRRE